MSGKNLIVQICVILVVVLVVIESARGEACQQTNGEIFIGKFPVNISVNSLAEDVSGSHEMDELKMVAINNLNDRPTET